MTVKTLNDYELQNKKILVRVDLNVPLNQAKILDSSRIERLVPTVRKIIKEGGRPILISHFGRPKGKYDKLLSLEQLIPELSRFLDCRVKFSTETTGTEALKKVEGLANGEVLLLENTRFNPQEEANELNFSKSLSELGDIFCNDAFSASHRAHASTVGVANFMPNCIGLLMQQELTALKSVLSKPKRPVVAVVGGAKVSTKIDLLSNLIQKVDHLVIGGGMANTFLHAQGNPVGASLCEKDLKGTALNVLKRAYERGCEVHIPHDVIIASDFKPNAKFTVVEAGKVPEGKLILDIGPSTCDKINQIFNKCETLIWNGPMGAFEITPFDKGTNITTTFAAKLTNQNQLISVAGGGDTVSALKNAGIVEDFSYVSLAGGAFLEWMEGKKLPGIACLE
ncbi:MAG: phosphoglycerate kinase [Rhodobacteraceae bacterium]|nr:MAG: phosphoglycerate kinase [Paracoccaceae bacterium]|tara:strand:- start:2468 stop:3655 length:1188 start_codon:yes stop_codon:yes gene_type:complete